MQCLWFMEQFHTLFECPRTCLGKYVFHFLITALVAVNSSRNTANNNAFSFETQKSSMHYMERPRTGLQNYVVSM